MNVNIRQASLEDMEDVVKIEEISFPKAEAATRESIEERLKAFTESFFVAEQDGKIVGFINGSVIEGEIIRDEFYSDISFHNPAGDHQSVFGLDVHPECRGRGIAATLMQGMIGAARKAGRKGVALCCKETKIPYYEKFGFVAIGQSDSKHGNAVWYDMILPLTKND